MTLPSSIEAADTTERAQGRTPLLGLLFGYGAMLPILGGPVIATLTGETARAVLLRLTLAWAAAILAFLGGVRRGLSFDEPNGAPARDLASMLWLFGPAFVALVLPWAWASFALLLIVYASLALIDRAAARAGRAPRFFSRLRPLQAVIAVAGLAVALVLVGGE